MFWLAIILDYTFWMWLSQTINFTNSVDVNVLLFSECYPKMFNQTVKLLIVYNSNWQTPHIFDSGLLTHSQTGNKRINF